MIFCLFSLIKKVYFECLLWKMRHAHNLDLLSNNIPNPLLLTPPLHWNLAKVLNIRCVVTSDQIKSN